MRKTEIAQSIAAVGDRVVQQALYNLFRAITGDDPRDGVVEGVMGPGPALQSLAQTGFPVGLPPNGTIAFNGQLTLDTALPTIYSGGIWLRFPPEAVLDDETGGLYWCVMTSTTQGTVYAPRVDTSLGFVARRGNTAVPVTGSDSPYMQDTSVDIVITRFTLPANSMGPRGRMRFNTALCSPSNANQKIFKWVIGPSNILLWSHILTTSSFSGGYPIEIRARGTDRIVTSNWGGATLQSSNPIFYATINHTVQQDIVAIAQLAVATDYVILEGFGAEVLYTSG